MGFRNKRTIKSRFALLSGFIFAYNVYNVYILINIHCISKRGYFNDVRYFYLYDIYI